MGKNYLDNWHHIKNTKDLTMKQVFDISEKLVSEQDEIYGVKKLIGKTILNKSSVFSAQRSTSLQILYCVLARYKRTPNRTMHGKTHWRGSGSPEYRDVDRIDGEPMEFECNIFPGFNTLQLSQEVKSLLLRLNERP